MLKQQWALEAQISILRKRRKHLKREDRIDIIIIINVSLLLKKEMTWES